MSQDDEPSSSTSDGFSYVQVRQHELSLGRHMLFVIHLDRLHVAMCSIEMKET